MMIGQIGWEKMGLTGPSNIWQLCCYIGDAHIVLRTGVWAKEFKNGFFYVSQQFGQTHEDAIRSHLVFKSLCSLCYKLMVISGA